MAAPVDPAWAGFFSAAAGAAATLVGLIIVAVSVNVQRILAFHQLPSRAGAGIGGLVLNPVTSMAALAPQPAAALAAEVLGFAAVACGWSSSGRCGRCSPPRPRSGGGRTNCWGRSASARSRCCRSPPSPAAMLAGDGGGAGWIAAGVVATFVAAVFNARVLLVEILR